MNLEFNGIKLTGNSVSDIDLEIRDILEADLRREATDEEMEKALGEITTQVKLSEYNLLVRIAEAVSELPFGKCAPLPWCRESFPLLDAPLLEWEQSKGNFLPLSKPAEYSKIECSECHNLLLVEEAEESNMCEICRKIP